MNLELLNKKRRILLVDDNDAIHGDFRKILTQRERHTDLAGDEEALFGDARPATPQIQFEIDSALQGEEGYRKVAAAHAAADPYHVAFVDMRMPPGWDGVQTIGKLWEIDPQLQVVICTAFSDYSWEQIIERLGYTDRLLILKKPFDELEVLQLATALTAKRLVTEQAAVKLAELENLVQARTADLKRAALVDKLTGLPNRELLNDRLTMLIHNRQRDPSHRFAVLFLDFDRFKVVNDSLGHEMGDLMLVNIAERLRKQTRDTDTLCASTMASRLGGDEFVVLLDNLRDPTDAARVAERLIDALAQPYDLRGHVVHSTVSIGITISAGGYGSAEDMLRDADTAMYRAKAAGKARYVVFDQRMHEEAMHRLTLENALRRAVDNGEMFLLYQPIVSMESGLVSGFEALVRWQHPQRGLIPPVEFIPLAEEIGAISHLGHWVLVEACRQLAAWRRQQTDRPRTIMSVNLSRRQLCHPELLQQIRSALDAAGLSPDDLCLEITESAIMDDPEGAIRVLGEIRGMGVHLHVDDFGTGYSSLSCLHRFPISGLKIDRSFVTNVNDRRDYAAVVQAIVTLAHNLGIELVAEGVETAEQLVMLQAMNCDHAQGYFFARPLPADHAGQHMGERLVGTAAAAAAA